MIGILLPPSGIHANYKNCTRWFEHMQHCLNPTWSFAVLIYVGALCGAISPSHGSHSTAVGATSLNTYQRTDGAHRFPRLIYTSSAGSPLTHTVVSKWHCGFIKEIYLCVRSKSNIYYTFTGICRSYQPHFEVLQTHPSYRNSSIPQLSTSEIRSKITSSFSTEHRIDVLESETVDWC